MKIIDNSAALQYDKKGDDSAFIAALSFGYVTSTKVLTVTEASTFPAGDGLRRVNIAVYDKNGDSKTQTITVGGGSATITLNAAASLDLSGHVDIKATIVTTNGLAKDGGFYRLSPVADASGVLVFEK